MKSCLLPLLCFLVWGCHSNPTSEPEAYHPVVNAHFYSWREWEDSKPVYDELISEVTWRNLQLVLSEKVECLLVLKVDPALLNSPGIRNEHYTHENFPSRFASMFQRHQKYSYESIFLYTEGVILIYGNHESVYGTFFGLAAGHPADPSRNEPDVNLNPADPFGFE